MYLIVGAQFECVRAWLGERHQGYCSVWIREVHRRRAGVKLPPNCRYAAWIDNCSGKRCAQASDVLVSPRTDIRRARRARSFVRPSGLDYLEVADVDRGKVVKHIRRKTIIRANRNRKETAAIIGHEGAVFLEPEAYRFFFNRPCTRYDETRLQPQPLAHCWIICRCRGDR